VDFTTAQLVDQFRSTPEQSTDSAAVQRLVDLYGPDSEESSALALTVNDLETIAEDTSSLRKHSEATMREADCLAEAVYYEARGESRSGQIAVAQVVQNRVLSRHYPDTICGVVYQGSERRTGCQFSFTCDGSMDKTPVGQPWDQANEVAKYVMTQTPRSIVGKSTHYHTDYVNPKWNRSLKRTVTVGSHIFYRFPFTERSRGASLSLRVAPAS
ncbi:MAG: cell wall hydrolase, partial [Pseudomonadota bacterium]